MHETTSSDTLAIKVVADIPAKDAQCNAQQHPQSKKFFWLAVNKASVAACPVPMASDRICCVPSGNSLSVLRRSKSSLITSYFCSPPRCQRSSAA
jgi:hypothetical protein